MYDDPSTRAPDYSIEGYAIDFVARRDREERRSYMRRPKKMADVIAQLLTKRGYGRIQTNADVSSAWAAAAGETLAACSGPGKLRRGTLEVTVSNSTMIQEFTFQKQHILAELGRTLPDAKIRDLRFRVGSIN